MGGGGRLSTVCPCPIDLLTSSINNRLMLRSAHGRWAPGLRCHVSASVDILRTAL